LNVAAHEADSGEDQTDEADHRARVFRERLDCLHEGLSAAKADRSLRMSDVRSTSKCEGNKCWPHHMRRTAKFLGWEVLNPPICGGIGRPVKSLLQPECAADSEHLCTSADLVSAWRKPKVAQPAVSNNKTTFGYSEL
jgi:hypothetical protein